MTVRPLATAFILLTVLPCTISSAASGRLEGEELIGTAAPGWGSLEWVRGGPLSFESFRGRVVLIRWWTGPECPYCAASAPHLREWNEKYSAAGFVILGFYHHKSMRPLSVRYVESLADQLGFKFPVAIDREWRTLRRWWLEGHERGYTSVSFLLDAKGIIRYLHPGGSYSREEAVVIESHIRKLLDERAMGR